MSITPRARRRAALVGTAALFAATTGAVAHAAASGPVAPDELFNGYQHCSTNASAPTYLWGTDGLVLEGVPQDPAAAAGDEFSAQYNVWPVSAPSQLTSYTSDPRGAGFEAPVTVQGSALTDGTTYAWQARSVDGSAVSNWSKTCYVAIDDDAPAAAPTITSANYPAGTWSPGGVPVQLTFGADGVSDVAGYEFVWDDVLPVYGVDIGDYGIPEPKSPWANTKYWVQAPTVGGSASVNLIPPPGSGPYTLTVVSLDRAYNESAQTTYQIYVHSTAPTITPAVASPQFDTSTSFALTPNATAEAASPIVAYSVSIGGGTPRTVKAGADGSATVNLKLNNVEGNNGVSVSSISANGWVSDAAQEYYYFDTTPVVNSDEYPEYMSSGGAGVAGTFTFTHQVPGIVSYTYSLDGGTTETTVPADKAGDAQITFTPPTDGANYDLNVYGTTKDGLTLLSTDYYFSVN